MRNIKAEQEAAARREYYQRELKKQILEQQRIREERKVRERMLERAEMRRLERHLRALSPPKEPPNQPPEEPPNPPDAPRPLNQAKLQGERAPPSGASILTQLGAIRRRLREEQSRLDRTGPRLFGDELPEKTAPF